MTRLAVCSKVSEAILREGSAPARLLCLGLLHTDLRLVVAHEAGACFGRCEARRRTRATMYSKTARCELSNEAPLKATSKGAEGVGRTARVRVRRGRADRWSAARGGGDPQIPLVLLVAAVILGAADAPGAETVARIPYRYESDNLAG